MKRCDRCDRILRPGDEAHIVDELVYCSADCAVLALTDEIVMNAKETAKEQYNESVAILTVRETDSANTCPNCGEDLASCETILAVEGALYCSRKCAIDYLSTHPNDVVVEIYVDALSEEVVPSDIGLEVQDEQSS